MMRFDRFTERAQDAIARSQEILMRYQHSQLDIEHILLALLEQQDGAVVEVLQMVGVDVDMLKRRLDSVLSATPKSYISGGGMAQIYVTPRVQHLAGLAGQEADRLGDQYISTEHLLLGIMEIKQGPSAAIFQEFGITKEMVLQGIEQVRGGSKVTDPYAETKYRILEKYGRDLTQLARDDKLDPVIGREAEILRVMRVLARRTKNNPVLIGEPGVGKTAIVEGLARRIVADDVPEHLRDRRLIELDLGGMVAGSRFRGEFEERLKAVLDEVRAANGEILLFIDEVHTVVGAGSAQGALDASDMMKPALARGELQAIGATTLDDYRNYIESDRALERRFAPVYVEEPSVEETMEMLRGLKYRYEAHHRVVIEDAAIEAAARLSHRYVTERFLPDKAIDLIDEAAAKLRVDVYNMPEELREQKAEVDRLLAEEETAWQQRDYETAAEVKSRRLKIEQDLRERVEAWRKEQNLDDVVEAEDIAEIVASWTGIPVSRMMKSEADKLLDMEKALHRRIVGQDEAVAAVSDAIRRGRSGLKDPRRPIGSFIFLGPTGVGKTELAKALAEFLFDDEDALVRVDMSEYREQHTVSRLIGSPPGYVGYGEGGQLTEAVRRRPFQVVLFDEIEKAHPEIFNVLLQLLDEGRLTDGQGRTVDFRNTVIIMTSNLGTRYLTRGGPLGFRIGARGDEEAIKDDETKEALKRTFRPEFLNRVDEVIVFEALTEEQIEQIVDLQVADLAERLFEQQEMEIELTEAARKWLAKRGYDPQFGARPLRRTIQRHVETPLSRKLLAGEFEAGDTILVDVKGDELVFRKTETE
jgi:ATP-dependent Clp protease ATP-binding subunit ClpC